MPQSPEGMANTVSEKISIQEVFFQNNELKLTR